MNDTGLNGKADDVIKALHCVPGSARYKISLKGLVLIDTRHVQ